MQDAKKGDMRLSQISVNVAEWLNELDFHNND